MLRKETTSLQRNIELGQSLNKVIGHPDPSSSLSDYMIDTNYNRILYGQVLSQTQLSSKEIGKYNRLLRAAIREGIDTVGELRTKSEKELAQIEGIGRESIFLLKEAFKQPL